MDQDQNIKVKCPECENEMDFNAKNSQVGDIFECSFCGANLEITSTEPLSVESVTTYK